MNSSCITLKLCSSEETLFESSIILQFPHGFTHPLQKGCYFGNTADKINLFHRNKSRAGKAVIRTAGLTGMDASNKMNRCLQWSILHRGKSVRFAS
jgi:hypothetical protein